jgi:hypothetical protein
MSRPKPAPHATTRTWPRNTAAANAARRGVRIHEPGPEWPATRKRLAKALQLPVRGLLSARQLAAAIRVHDKTIARWASGRHLPSAPHARKVAAWLNRVAPSKS